MSIEGQKDLSKSQEAVVDAGKVDEVKNLLDNMQKNSDARKNFVEELTKSVEGVFSGLDDETKKKLSNSILEVFNNHQGEAGFDNVKEGLLSIGRLLGLKENDGKLVQDSAETGASTQSEGADNTQNIELPNSPLKGTLESIEEGEDSKKESKLYSNLVRNGPEEGQEDNSEQGLRLYEATAKLSGQLSKIDELLGNDKLKDNGDINGMKNILENVKRAIDNTTENNVKLLQQYIYENLDGQDQTDFGGKSRRKNGEFDGKFGVGTLAGLNKILEKTGSYIEDLKKAEDVMKNNEKQSDSQKAETPEKKTDSTPLSLNNKNYPVVDLKTQNLPQMKGATFYLTTEIALPVPEGGEQGQQKPETENGERVFYLKFGNGDLFRVKVDNDGNLCPVATKINDKNPKETVQTLIKNNESCINYLKNKLPSAIKDKCKIGWSGDDYVIGKDGYANWLTIEPMTIAGKWLSSGAQSTNLSDSLAFLNFTNFLRNEGKIMGVEFKGNNPDLTIQNDQLYVRVNRKINKKISKKNGEEKGELGWKYQKIDLRSFGLPGVDNPAFKNFIKYNNHEDWGDNWDKKPENKNYTKVDFPDIVVNNPSNPASSTTETPSDEIPTPDPTVSTNSALQKAQDESELDGVVVTGNRLRPKNPINFDSEDEELMDGKTGKLEGVGAFDSKGNFEFEDKIKEKIEEVETGKDKTIVIGHDTYTMISYEKEKGMIGFNGGSKEDFNGKGYQVGDTGEMKWFYIGDYKEGQKSGTGTRIFENGAIYNGGWSEGRENGQGKYTYPNGDVYEGSFVEGQFNGQGTYTWKNGTKFEGEFKNDKMTEGKLIIKSGDGSEKDYNVKKDDNGLKIIEGNDAGKYVDLMDNVTDAPIEQNKAPEKTSAVEPDDKSTEYSHQIVTNNSKVSVATVEEEPDSGNLGIEGIGYMNSDGEFLFDGNVEKFDGASKNFYIEIGDNNYFRLDDGDEVKDGYCYTIIGGPAEPDGIVIGNINNGKYEGNVIVVNKNYKYEGTVDGVYTKFNKGTITFPNGNKYEVEKDDKGLKIRSSGQYEGEYINADTGQIVDTAQ